MYWLWQRQPTTQDKTTNTKISSVNPSTSPLPEELFTFSPQGNVIVSKNKIDFEGKTSPNEFVLVFSNFSQNISKADNQGKFQISINLAEGINQITLKSLDESFKESYAKTVSFYQDSESKDTKFYSGLVKSTFDTLITITVEGNDQTIRQKSSTELFYDDSIDEEDTDIRVGDFIMALGNATENKDFDANSLYILRNNKPKNISEYLYGIFTSDVKANIFSARDQKNANLVEFFLSTETGFLIGSDEGTEDDIVKDNRALILFHEDEDNDNVADLIYILP